MGLDMTMVSVGEFGKYQRRIFILLCLAGIPFSIFDTGPVFWADVPQYQCNDTRMIQYKRVNHYLTDPNNNENVNVTQEPDNDDDGDENSKVNLRDMFDDVPNEGCYLPRPIAREDTDKANTTLTNKLNEKQYCANYSFESAYVTIVGRWSLVCQNKWWLVLLHHMYTIGQIMGCLLTGFFSDRFGRRVTLVVCTAVQVPISVLAAVVPNLVSFTVLRTILAVATAGQFNTAFIQVIELLGPAWRVFGGTIFFCFLPLGNLILTGAAYYFRNYIALKLVTSIPLAFLLVYIWVLPESVRWMYSRGQSEDVRGHLKYITEINKIEGADDLADRQLDNNEKVQIPCDLTTKPLMRKKIIVLSYIWWTCVVVLTTINYELLMRSRNRYIIVPVGAAFDILAYATSMLCLYKFGRRLPLTIALVVTGIALQCTAPAPLALKDFHTTMLVMAKVFCTISMAILRIYTAELLPTALRGSGLGVITGVSYFGANVMPFMLKLNSVHVDLSHILEGGMCVMAALSVLFIPTTYKQALPDTVKEGEAMGTNQHMLFFVVEERAGSITTKVVRPKSHSVAVTTPRVPARPRFSLPDGKLRLTVPKGINREKRKSWHTLLPEKFVKEGSSETAT